MVNDKLGTVEEMLAWALSIMDSREPDFTISDGDDQPYMERWFVIPRNPAGGCYIHRILRSDKDTHHDHPWDNTTYILRGEYHEEMLGQGFDTGTTLWHRKPGDIIHRTAERAHRLILPEGGEPPITLFLLGPWKRDWGFHCPKGWVPWWEFTAEDKGRVGRGCGEYA